MAPEMVARALLLLRAATAFTISNFNDAGIRTGSGDLRAWIDPLAVARGFWKPAAPLGDPADLWADVKDALGDLGIQGASTDLARRNGRKDQPDASDRRS